MGWSQRNRAARRATAVCIAFASLLTTGSQAHAQTDGQQLLDRAIQSLEFGDDGGYQQAVEDIAASDLWFPSTLDQALAERDIELIIMVWFVIDAPDDRVLRTAMDMIDFEREALLYGSPEFPDEIERSDLQGLTALEALNHRQLPTTPEIDITLSLLPDDVDAYPDESTYHLAIAHLAGVLAGTPIDELTALPENITPTTLSAESVDTAVVDTEQTILQDALVALRAEQDVIKLMPGNGNAPSDDVRTALTAADQAGMLVMARAQAADIALSPETQFVLSRMPRPDQGDRRVPADYDTAIILIEARLDILTATPTSAVDDAAVADPIADATGDATATPPIGSVATVSPPTTIIETAPNQSNNAAPWIAVGGISFAAVMLGLFALRRSREAHGLVGLANTDGLTGLHNRRKFDADIEEHQERGDAPVAMLMIDVDRFKSFNDVHGHSTGDKVLRLVSTALTDSVRRGDVAYRYGGEEFCALLPDTSPEEALQVAERIRAAVESIDLPVDATLTASVGLASGVSSELNELVEHADTALYAAKETGRNRVVSA